MCFFPEFSKVCNSPSLALVCYWLYKKGQPIGGTVHLHSVENFEGLLQRYVGDGGVAVYCEKHNFSWTPCRSYISRILARKVLIAHYDVLPIKTPIHFYIMLYYKVIIKILLFMLLLTFYTKQTTNFCFCFCLIQNPSKRVKLLNFRKHLIIFLD